MVKRMTVGEATQWHPHFVWWPTPLDGGGTAWLRTVERRLTIIPDLDPGLRFLFGLGYWRYRRLAKQAS